MHLAPWISIRISSVVIPSITTAIWHRATSHSVIYTVLAIWLPRCILERTSRHNLTRIPVIQYQHCQQHNAGIQDVEITLYVFDHAKDRAGLWLFIPHPTSSTWRWLLLPEQPSAWSRPPSASKTLASSSNIISRSPQWINPWQALPVGRYVFG